MSKPKLGRNDHCYCGSGKKYKKCCMTKDMATQPTSSVVVDFEWCNLRKLEGAVFDKYLIPYLTQELPIEVAEQALEDGGLEELPAGADKELFFNNFFLPWSLFNWIPFDDFGLEAFNPELTLSQNYVLLYEQRLNSQERRFINEMNNTFYSFYSITAIERDKTMCVKDILLETTHTLKERQGTHFLKRGDIVFGRILTLDKQAIFVGMAPIQIPPDYHYNLLDLKKWLIEKENDNKPLTSDVLRNEFDLDLLDYFFEILESAYNRPPPTLVNTDGELLQLSKNYFRITLSPEETLKRLLPMTLSKDPNEFLSDADSDDSGNISQVECPWLKKGNKKHKGWDNTILGHIKIQKDRLILETNSEERIKKAKKLLAKYLGESCTFQQTLIESLEQHKSSANNITNKKANQTELLELPEIQEQLAAMAKAHWENWFDEPIPVLDNKTPREAAKTKSGQEQLEALLLQYEYHDAERGNDFFKADINYLRKELKLD